MSRGGPESVYNGKDKSYGYGVPDGPSVSVFFIAESLRGGDEPRVGSDLFTGGFDILDELFDALSGSTIVTDCQLTFVDEKLVASDDKSVVYEQKYEVIPFDNTKL